MFNEDITIHGKHAHYMKALGDKENSHVFKRFFDVFINGAIVGLIYNQREDRDKDSQYKDVVAKIMSSTINKERGNLEYIYRLIMLLDDSTNLKLEAKINRAFRDDSSSDITENHKENMDLFFSYVLGGISILYDKIVVNSIEKDDYFKQMNEFIESRSEKSFEEGSADRLIENL